MSNKWFTNHGQIIQILLSGATLAISAWPALKDVQSSQWFELAPIVFAGAFAWFISALIWKPNAKMEIPVEKTEDKPAEARMRGNVKILSADILLGDAWTHPDEKSFRIELRKIAKTTGKMANISTHAAEISVRSNLAYFSIGDRAKETGRDLFLLPVPENKSASFKVAYGLTSTIFEENNARIFQIFVDHISPVSRRVTLTVVSAHFRVPLFER